MGNKWEFFLNGFFKVETYLGCYGGFFLYFFIFEFSREKRVTYGFCGSWFVFCGGVMLFFIGEVGNMGFGNGGDRGGCSFFIWEVLNRKCLKVVLEWF